MYEGSPNHQIDLLRALGGCKKKTDPLKTGQYSIV